MTKTITYIATTKSKKIINDALRQDKKFFKTGEGESADWDEVFKKSTEASAKTKNEVLEAVTRGRKATLG